MITTTAASVPPLSPYGTLVGSLFQYSRNLVAFESFPGTVPPPHKCILIGGLSDGLMPTPYTSSLQDACFELGWSLVQPILSSSYTGFGHGDLDRDTSEMNELMLYLKCHRSAERFALVGHSTGCQNSIHFLKHGQEEMIERTKVVALQAPVSDREDAMMQPNYNENIEHARKLVKEGKETEMMPRSAFWAPITAKRFLDLQDKGGADDYFSSDLEDLVDRLRHVGQLEENGLHLLAAYSGSDEYVPQHVDTRELVQRFCEAMNHDCQGKRQVATPLYLARANHNLSESEGDADIFVDMVAELLARVMP